MTEGSFNETENIREEMEREYAKRFDELNRYEQFLATSDADEEFQGSYRKMLTVMLYAYFEGFCKKALEIYAEYINSTHEQVENLQDIIATETLHREFLKLENTNYNPIQIKGVPTKDDRKLQRDGRRCEFFKEYREQMQKSVCLPDDIIDTESNLKPHVLKMLLFRLALDYTIVDNGQNTINQLLMIRNSIAHGDIIRGITKDQYEDFKEKAFEIMNNLKSEIIKNYREKRYLKTGA